MFPGLMFKPGQGGALPFMGRRRFVVGGFGKRFQPPKIYGRLGYARGAARPQEERDQARPAAPLQSVLRGDVGHARRARHPLAARRGRLSTPIFDHLLVVDRGDANDGRRWRRSKVVGTYRMLRQEVADLYDGFYTQGEYDIAPLLRTKPECKLHRAWPLLRAQALSQQAHARAAVAGRVVLCARAWRRRDDRLRQLRGNRPLDRMPRRSAFSTTTRSRPRIGASGRTTISAST